MKGSFDVQLVMNRPAADVLGAICSATERETLPFVSASRYPMQREKEFVGAVSGNRFRIWKVPSATRSRQNVCHPYLHGEVRGFDGGSNLTASFSLHPFDRIIALIPLAIIGMLWLWSEGTMRSRMILVGFSLLFLLMEVLMVGSARRLRPHEQKDIVRFLLALFPDAQDVTAGSQSPIVR